MAWDPICYVPWHPKLWIFYNQYNKSFSTSQQSWRTLQKVECQQRDPRIVTNIILSLGHKCRFVQKQKLTNLAKLGVLTSIFFYFGSCIISLRAFHTHTTHFCWNGVHHQLLGGGLFIPHLNWRECKKGIWGIIIHSIHKGESYAHLAFCTWGTGHPERLSNFLT